MKKVNESHSNLLVDMENGFVVPGIRMEQHKKRRLMAKLFLALGIMSFIIVLFVVKALSA
jgi:hypothetical protein